MFGMDKETTQMVFQLLTLIVTGILGIYMRKMEKNTNHKMDQLLASTAESSHAQGKLEGKAESRSERIEDVAAVVTPAAPSGGEIKVETINTKELIVDKKK